MKEAKKIGGRECMIYQEGEQPAVLLIQPISFMSKRASITRWLSLPSVLMFH